MATAMASNNNNFTPKEMMKQAEKIRGRQGIQANPYDHRSGNHGWRFYRPRVCLLHYRHNRRREHELGNQPLIWWIGI